jgi:hypothetical protein
LGGLSADFFASAIEILACGAVLPVYVCLLCLHGACSYLQRLLRAAWIIPVNNPKKEMGLLAYNKRSCIFNAIF